MSDKPRLRKYYEKEAVPRLMSELGLKNRLAAPTFVKVTVNVGLKQALKDPKFIDVAERTLSRIAGQKPVKTLAKKSISNFKVRKGMVVGIMVTLRGRRMWDFIDRLINVTLPRVRDFRGVSARSVDAHGNISIGFREFIAFPEIRPEDTDTMHGMEVTLVTDARTRERGRALLKAVGFPLKEDIK